MSTGARVGLEGGLGVAEKAFVSLSLLNILRFPMTMLPGIISAMVQLAVSNKRVKSYLTSEELDERQVERLGEETADAKKLHTAGLPVIKSQKLEKTQKPSFKKPKVRSPGKKAKSPVLICPGSGSFGCGFPLVLALL